MKIAIPFVAFFWGFGFSGAAPADEVEIQEWQVPWEDSRPRDAYVQKEGKVWFVGQRGNYLANLDVETGKFERFELDPGTGPHNLIVDEDQNVWYAGNRDTHIGKLNPKTGEIQKYRMPDPAARDPHTLIFNKDNYIWFTVQQGNFIGTLHKETGEIRLVPSPTPKARPYGIVIDSKNAPWVAQFGSNKIATVDMKTRQVREFELPHQESRPRRIGLTSDDRVWYTDYSRGSLGMLDPDSGESKEWGLPGGASSRPYGMAVDDQDKIWLVESGPDPNRLVGFDPRTEEFFSVTKIPSGGGTVRHMMFHAATKEVWFGTDTNTIGRFRVR